MRNGTVAALLIVALIVGGGVGYLVGIGVLLPAQGHETTIALVATTTLTMNASTVAEYTGEPFFYVSDGGICTGSGGYVPCWGYPAYVFNSCPNLLSGPPAPYTCTYTVMDTIAPYPSYSISVTLALSGQANEPQWANCSLLDASKMTSYVDCIPVINSTAFIIGEPAPPPA